MQVQGMQVVVAGAATAGAATALLLARAGATVRVLDRVPEMRAAGAGIALAANGQAVLERLQLNTLLNQATQINGARIVDANERTLLAPPDGTDLRIVTRAALQAALFEAMRSTSGIAITLGATVEAATPDGRVTVRHAATGRTDDLQADLVVGADGVHSRVREQGGFAAEVRRSGIHYVRAISPTPAAGCAGSLDVRGALWHDAAGPWQLSLCQLRNAGARTRAQGCGPRRISSRLAAGLCAERCPACSAAAVRRAAGARSDSCDLSAVARRTTRTGG